MKTIAVIFGGNSTESDVSVLTALQAIDSLDRSKYDVVPLFMNDGFYYRAEPRVEDFARFDKARFDKVALLDGALYVVRRGKPKLWKTPDVALLCTHGGYGENGVLQAVLEWNGIAYTSCGVLSSAVGMDKIVQKQLFSEMLLNVVDYVAVESCSIREDCNRVACYLQSFLGYPIIIKPSEQGSSIGIDIVRDYDSLIIALTVAASYGKNVIAERALEDFIEVNCAAFRGSGGLTVSQTEQPLNWRSFLSFEDKYIGGKYSANNTTHLMPAPIGDMNDRVRDCTKRIYSALSMRGVVRVDYFVDMREKKLYVNEINTIPGSLAHYLFLPDIRYGELLDSLIEQAETELKERKGYITEYDSSVLREYNCQKYSVRK